MNIAIDVTGWEMIESITWYLKNTKETLPKFQENCIYIKKKIVATNIYHIFWVYNLRLLQSMYLFSELKQHLLSIIQL